MQDATEAVQHANLLRFECRPRSDDLQFNVDIKVIAELPGSTRTLPAVNEFLAKLNTNNGFFCAHIDDSYGDAPSRATCVSDGSLACALDAIEHYAWRNGLRAIQTATGQYDDSGYRIPNDLRVYLQRGYKMSVLSALMTWWDPNCPVLVWKKRPDDLLEASAGERAE